MMTQKTFLSKPSSTEPQWHLVDAQDKVLGRLAVQVAQLLRGKQKVTFTPHVDGGDGVVVINAGKIRVTGNKMETKTYQRYSGYPGGLREETLKRLLDRRPTEVIRRAVVGMLPHNPLGRQAARRLRIYTGPQHPHAAQLKQTS